MRVRLLRYCNVPPGRGVSRSGRVLRRVKEMRTSCVRLGAVLLLGCAGAVRAGLPEDGIIQPGLYQLHNHPAGTARQPLYGLRLDELYNVTGGHDIWTFDFDATGSEMFLDYSINGANQAVIRIYGTTFGGLDVGSAYHATHQGFFEVDFTYTGMTLVNGDDDIHYVGPNDSNTGSITPVDGNGDPTGPSKPLFDYSMGHSLRIGDESNDNGHRGFDGISGWGWMHYQAGGGYIASTDWLFTIDPKPVPAPGAAALGLIGFVAARFATRRKMFAA